MAPKKHVEPINNLSVYSSIGDEFTSTLVSFTVATTINLLVPNSFHQLFQTSCLALRLRVSVNNSIKIINVITNESLG